MKMGKYIENGRVQFVGIESGSCENAVLAILSMAGLAVGNSQLINPNQI